MISFHQQKYLHSTLVPLIRPVLPIQGLLLNHLHSTLVPLIQGLSVKDGIPLIKFTFYFSSFNS